MKAYSLLSLFILSALLGGSCKKKHNSQSTPVQPAATVATASVSNIGGSFAVCGGNIITEDVIQGKGVCWDTLSDPTLSNSYSSAEGGNQTKSFLAVMEGLKKNTTYHVRAYIVCSSGTFYGEDVIFKTNDGWIKVSQPGHNVGGISSFYMTNLIATGGTGLIGVIDGNSVNSHSFVVSPDNGKIWANIGNGGLPLSPYSLWANSSAVFAGINNGIYRSTNNGTNWSQVYNGSNVGPVQCFAQYGSKLFAGSSSGGVLVSSDDGTTWSPSGNGLSSGLTIYSITDNGQSAFAGTSAGLYRSDDTGVTWAYINGSTQYHYYNLAAKGNTVYAMREDGAMVSYNSGSSWNLCSGLTLQQADVMNFIINGNVIYAGCRGGIFISVDAGANWKNMDQVDVQRIALSGSVITVNETYGGFYNFQL